MDNPYASPITSDSIGEDSPLTPERERYAQIGEVFVGWERLRMWYNLVLAVVALLGLVGVALLRPALLLELVLRGGPAMVAAAVGANACFFAGHIVEGYGTWWFGPIPWLRRVIFVVGTAGAILLTLIVIAGLAFAIDFPNQD